VQIPDIRTGDDVIDAVVVDEDSVGGEASVRGAKILYGRGAFDRYLSKEKNGSEVCIICNDMNIVFFVVSN
jgi:ATP-dependent Clp protease ATP-binding subunit ClpX